MILTDARTRVLALVDDDGTRYNTDGLFTEIDDALLTGQKEVWQLLVNSGASIFEIEASVPTNGSGVADLTTIKPLRLINVALSTSNQRLEVAPCRLDQAPTNALFLTTLAITYVPRLSFPAAGGNSFVWGHANITDTAAFDKLMCLIAASEIKIKDGEINKALEQRKGELKAHAVETLSIPSWSVLPMDQYGRAGKNRFHSGYEYVMTAPDTLQLVLG